jgi:DNA-binding XRE family transcriptional regulator
MQAKRIEAAQARRYRKAAGEEFGLFVYRERKRAGLTQDQLAKKLGVRQTEISRLETGHYCPRLDSVVKVITALRADPQALVEAIAGHIEPDAS